MCELETFRFRFEVQKPFGKLKAIAGDFDLKEFSFRGFTPSAITKMTLDLEAGKPAILHVRELDKEVYPGGTYLHDLTIDGPVRLVMTTQKVDRMGGNA